MKVKIRPHLILLDKNLDPKANLLQKTVLPAMLIELVHGLNVENDLPQCCEAATFSGGSSS